ncbi:MAG: hypothetical protein K5650_08570 [Bacteroidales bacterium]|nr:hypothetical protein [Bacteroidales bacterium]
MVKVLRNRLLAVICVLLAVVLPPAADTVCAQQPEQPVFMARPLADSVRRVRRPAVVDSLRRIDSTRPDPEPLLLPARNAVSDIIHYRADDSIAINLDTRRAFLYTAGNIEYQEMSLQADRVTVDFESQTLHAAGAPDSAGTIVGRPFFKQNADEYHADTITFNYNTQKGIITGVITQEGDGFLHGSKVKKMNDSVMYLASGQYTTCNYTHPHFAVNFSKSKLITNDKIVSGPAYLSIEDVPTPVALPFAFFPMTNGRASGLIVPSYGWMNGRGYYLRDGGFYWAASDNFDLALLGEIYTNLSWAAETRSNYYVRYRCKGNLDMYYGNVIEGLKGDPTTYNTYSDFKFTWRHEQDAKANPYGRFSANVNLQSRNYNRTTSNRNDYFSSTTTSSISYTTKVGSYFNLSASARESFNAKTGVMTIKLPSVSLNSVTVYPLRRRNPVGAYRWWEKIQLSYVLTADNNVTAQDTDILKRTILDRMQYGVRHSVPLSSSVKVFKYFNWTNSVNYIARWYGSHIERTYDQATGTVTTDTVRAISTNREFNYTTSLTSRIYGTFQFKHGPLKALRHVINPSLSFSYHPDFGSERLGYWRQYTDNTGYVHRYSIFQNSIYGGPPDGVSGNLRLSISNNLEAKIAMPWDTSDTPRKVKLIENLTLAMSYDIAKDSLNLSDLAVTGRTTLFKNLVLNYSGSFCPYVIDSAGRKHNRYVALDRERLFIPNNSNWSAQLSYSINPTTFQREGRGTEHGATADPILQTPYGLSPAPMMGPYMASDMKWNLSFNYTINYVNRYVAALYDLQSDLVQTLSFNASLSPTRNWRLSLSSGYDFVGKGMSYTTVDIYRDLHCWEMRFSWTPFGYYRSWNFQINIKADALRDVKYQKRRSYLEN